MVSAALTRGRLVDKICEGTGLVRRTTNAAVGTIIDAIVTALRAGETVELRGLGSFRPRPIKARTARNPKTGEAVAVQARYRVHFRPGRGLRVTPKD